MTAQDPFYPEIGAFYDAVLFNSFKGVVRTSGLKTTPLSDYGTNYQLISPNTDSYKSLHFIAWCWKRALNNRAFATSDRARWQTAPYLALSKGAWLKRHNPKTAEKTLAESLLLPSVLPDFAG
jgi:hypothetical protein